MTNSLPGVPYPLGATLDADGANFALYSEGAEAVELCLFDADGEETRIAVHNRTAFVWHVYVPGVVSGTRYGYRVYGAYRPESGLRFNPNVVLLDPYARATDGVEDWERGCFAYRLGAPEEDLAFNRDNQLGAPRGVVLDPAFDWEGDAPPAIPLHRSVIYETHVRGLTMKHPGIPEALRGTYSGLAHPVMVRQVLTLIMDSLRYWASEMHVDGFRFDLASSLARQLHEVDKLSSFFALIHQAPGLRNAKIIAEPWDVGDGGYQVGNFPVRWAEWNGRYRDAVRALWRGDGGRAGEIGYRLTGSSDLYESSGRRPSASINLVTAHDGSTLLDLVTYQSKHNEANGKGNRDGSDHELGWNCGVEGITDEPEIQALRRRQQRNLLMTLLVSQGTPMLLGGDEFGRTQKGNNNAYCQDNELSWYDWNWSKEQRALFAFTKRLLHVRRAHPGLHRANFFQGRSIIDPEQQDIRWLRHDGEPMSESDWDDPATRSFGMFLAGRGINDFDEEGRPVVDDDLLILSNASRDDLDFTLPKLGFAGKAWNLLVNTADDSAEEECAIGEVSTIVARSMKFFRSAARVMRNGGAYHSLGATYRLQLAPTFGFSSATAVVGYLAELGISDVYCSPILKAGRGSTHGYDVVDHSALNPALGTEAEFRGFVSALRDHKLGFLLDWVPNHMGIASGQNR